MLEALRLAILAFTPARVSNVFPYLRIGTMPSTASLLGVDVVSLCICYLRNLENSFKVRHVFRYQIVERHIELVFVVGGLAP
jgi:hypothetical protein